MFSSKPRVVIPVGLAVVPILMYAIDGINVTRSTKPRFAEDPAMPQFADLYTALLVAIALVLLRVVLTPHLDRLAHAFIAPARFNEMRVKRFSAVIFKAAFHSSVTVAGFLIMKDEPWFPRSLGGSGEVVESFNVRDEPPSQALKLYLLVQLAFHTHNLLYVLLVLPFRAGLMDTVLHDVATMVLISSAFLINFVPMTAVGAFLNDLCDAVSYLYNSFMDSERSPLVETLCFSMLATWLYARLIVFPTEFLYATAVVLPQLNSIQPLLLLCVNAMMAILFLLHAYWFVLYVRKSRALLLGGMENALYKLASVALVDFPKFTDPLVVIDKKLTA